MENKYIWLILAGVAGNAVFQAKKGDPMHPARRFVHLAAGGVCAVYASPFIIGYYELSSTDLQYLVPFGVGMFWLKMFEALDASISGIKLPWGKS